MIYDKNILRTYCPNTGWILSDTGKFCLANVPWPTVICSPEILYLHFCCHLTQFRLVSSQWLPNFHAYITIKFGRSTASQGFTPKGWKEENCLEYEAVNNISSKYLSQFNFGKTINLCSWLPIMSPNWRLHCKFSHQYFLTRRGYQNGCSLKHCKLYKIIKLFTGLQKPSHVPLLC